MVSPGFPVARTRTTLPAAAAIVFLAVLTIAAAWSAGETARAGDEVRRSSETLVQLARLRAAIAETRVTPSLDASPKSPARRARNAARALEKLRPGRRPDELSERVRERSSGRAADHAALDREIARLVQAREAHAKALLDDAGRRLKTRGLQTLFLVGVQGMLAASAAALAFRRS